MKRAQCAPHEKNSTGNETIMHDNKKSVGFRKSDFCNSNNWVAFNNIFII